VSDESSLAQMREHLAARVITANRIGSSRVAAALRDVPRHLFLPELRPEAVYRDDAIVTKRDETGQPISSSSQPAIMAIMLDQLDLAPGHRVLEIGAGTGYNAALISHIVGPSGRVTSVDIDPELVRTAREHLARAGFAEVTVVGADGAVGDPEHAPYDRIIATVGVSDLAPAWLAQAAPAWRDAVRVVAIDMCSIYASAVRRVLPGARIAVDLFHVVHLAVKMTGDVRRRVVRGKYGRRGRSGDPEYGIKNLLARNLEHLSPGQFAKVTSALQADLTGQEIAAAWIGKEKLRHALNLRARVTGSVPCERDVRDRLFAFYDWCACNDDIPELLSLARTISRWEDEIVCAVLTGVTNATSESLNRLAKLEARLAYGFRNPANQRRRVRIACTRGTRRRSRTATTKRTHPVTGPKPHPG